MCNAIPSGDEHAPPQAFFPPKYQGKSLETVPSCDKHNLANAKDVEYVRGVLCIQYGTNKTAEDVFAKAKESWDHSPKLFNRTFDGIVKAEVVNGTESEEIGVFEIDLPRVKNVMTALAHAIYYREKGHAWHCSFEVFCAFHSHESLQGHQDGSEKIGKWFCAREYEPRRALHADVFEYQVHEDKELIFAMRFYGGPWIYARRVGRVVLDIDQPILTVV